MYSPIKTRFTYTSPPPGPRINSVQVSRVNVVNPQLRVQYPIYPVYEVVYEPRKVDIKSPIVASRILK